MSWEDRLQTPRYVSPSRREITFLYEDVSVSFDKKTTAFEFSDASGTFVQDRGATGWRLPVRAIFSGEDYDQDADDFFEMLSETGLGKLDHPMYGVGLSVVPFGKVNRVDRLKSGANQAVFDVLFFQTNDLLFPVADASPADVVEATVTKSNEQGAKEFEDKTDLDTEVEKSSLADQAVAAANTIRTALARVSRVSAEIQRRVTTVFESIIASIDLLVGTPLTLAAQMQQLAQLPAQSAALIADKMAAYGNLLESIVGADGSGSPGVPGNDSQPQNTFRTQDLAAANAIIGAIVSTLAAEFASRSDALAAADQILEFCADFIAWRDANLVALSVVDTGESYQQVQEACAVAAGFLVEISFTLKQERTLVTDRPRTLIDLEAELYRTVGTNLDRLIVDNNLVVDQILEVPEGTAIRYYV